MENNFDTMYKNGMGSLASMQMGQQYAAGQAVDAEKLRGMRLENDQAAVMNPLNAQFKQGQIDTQAAQLPGQVGASQSLMAQGQFDTQTLSSKVAKQLADNANSIGEDGMKQLGRNGEIALKVAQMLPQYPPALHKQVIAKAFQTYGGDPGVVQGILQMPDAAVGKGLEVMGKGMAMASADYMQKNAMNTADNQSRERIAGGNNATQIQVANINAQSKLQAAQLRASQMANSMGIDKAIANYEMAKAQNGGQLSPEDEQALVALKTQALQQRAAGANQTTPGILGMPSNMDTAATAARGGAPAPTQVQAQPQSGDVAGAAKQAWGSYDPANYDYRIDPATGKAQRKRK